MHACSLPGPVAAEWLSPGIKHPVFHKREMPVGSSRKFVCKGLERLGDSEQVLRT